MDLRVMDKIRSFLGIQHEPPKNDFRNPIWGSDDDDDDVDELYTRDHITLYDNQIDLHKEISEHMQRMFKSFGSMFGDIKVFFHDDHSDPFDRITDTPRELEDFNPNSLRDYYLKPGYHMNNENHKDIDLDGEISSQEISGLLKQKEEDNTPAKTPFDNHMLPARSFCQTIITTSITKPDGTIETRKIIKNGNEVIEETTTTSDVQGSFNSPDYGPSGIIYNNLTELMSLFRNFY